MGRTTNSAPSVVKKQTGPEYAYYDKVEELKRAMPISRVYIVGSCILWVVISWALYKGVVYGVMYMRFDDSDLQAFCEEDFYEDATENFERLQYVPKGDSFPYLPALGLTAINPKKSKANGSPLKGIASPEMLYFPPIVTAVTSDDFLAVQGLVKQVKTEVRPLFEDNAAVKFIIFELSLTNSEKDVLSRHCDCLVRSVEPSKFPPHILEWYTYSWKAVFIQIILQEFGSAMWVDPSATLLTHNLQAAVSMGKQTGYLFWPEDSPSGLIAYTNPPTFKFYKENRCTFKDTVVIDSSAMIFYATDFCLQGIMTPWLKCVLTESCVAPSRSRVEDCLPSRAPLYTGCHKYDQSALSIVVNRLLRFSENTEKYVPNFKIAERRETFDEQFPERPWTRNHRNYVIYVVILIALCGFLGSIFGPLFLECMHGVRFRSGPKQLSV